MTDTYPPTHQVTFDWQKVIMCRYWYKNQDNSCQKGHLPRTPTVYGNEIDPADSFLPADINDNIKSLVDYARGRNMLDTWTPVCQVTLQAHHSLLFTGNKARSIWREWNKRIYGKDKRKRSDTTAPYRPECSSPGLGSLSED